MGSDNDSSVAISDSSGVHTYHSKGLAPPSVHSGEVDDVPAAAYTEEENRLLVRKLDWHVGLNITSCFVSYHTDGPRPQILPFIWWCYLFNSLDRNNISNAKSDGMTGMNWKSELEWDNR